MDLALLPAGFIPADPPYLSDRFRDDFEFRFLPDTTLFGRRTQVIQVNAHPTHGHRQALRSARYYVDRELGAVVALHLERSTEALFYSENSEYYIRLRPGPIADWVPYLMQIAVRLQLPLRPARSVSRKVAFYGYQGQ